MIGLLQALWPWLLLLVVVVVLLCTVGHNHDAADCRVCQQLDEQDQQT